MAQSVRQNRWKEKQTTCFDLIVISRVIDEIHAKEKKNLTSMIN